MEARKCDVCGGFYLPYIASNKIGGKSDSYNEIIVKEKRMGLKNANRYQEYDVCGKCSKELNKWLKGNKEN